jgi:hypothetical protein
MVEMKRETCCSHSKFPKLGSVGGGKLANRGSSALGTLVNVEASQHLPSILTVTGALPRSTTHDLLVSCIANTITMPELPMPDPEELGGNVTKPFKFVTGTSLTLR